MQVHDEVCGMTIPAEQAAATVEFQGRTYHFCSERCERMFSEHPDWYVEVTPAQDVASPGTEPGHCH